MATGGLSVTTKCMSVADDVALIEECLRTVANMVSSPHSHLSNPQNLVDFSSCPLCLKVFASEEDIKMRPIATVLHNNLMRFPSEARIQEMSRALLIRMGCTYSK